jgi:hypothetical protein
MNNRSSKKENGFIAIFPFGFISERNFGITK